jgi:hypothetical protein
MIDPKTAAMKFAVFSLLAVCLSSAPRLYGETIFAVDVSNRLLTFDSAAPGTPSFINGGAPVSGLQAGESILAIDFRPVATNSPQASSNGSLYGLGSSNRLYVINTGTAAAVPVGVAGSFTLTGNAFGMDFNPTTGLLRVVSDLGQNIRLDPFNATLVATDNNLAYAIGDSGFGLSPGVTGSAYTNNFGGAAQSTLYSVDFSRDVLVRQGGINGVPSPSGGQLTTIGPIGLNFTEDVGFDISGVTGTAYASLSSVVGPQDPSSSLYSVNLATGESVRVGSIGPGGGVAAFVTRDIAVPVGVPVPEPGGTGLLAAGLAVMAFRRRRRGPHR